MDQGEGPSWWYNNGRLYEVFLGTITAGDGPTSQELGFLAIGYQVDSTVAEHLALVAGNQIALATGDRLIASTLPPKDEAAMQRRVRGFDPGAETAEDENVPYTGYFAPCFVWLPGPRPGPV